jgi:hypothetical protein
LGECGVACLTFIIPVRHQDSSDQWDVLVKNLGETMQSISAQTSSDWKCIIVANTGAKLPEMPDGFDVYFVNLPPNVLYKRGEADIDVFRDKIRLDKGMRILAGIESAGSTNYLMFVDDDDFIHRDLTAFVCEHKGENGWYVKKGLIWKDGGDLVLNTNRFNQSCGTSHIVRYDLLDMVYDSGEASVERVKELLGSHIHLKNQLDKNDTPLQALPFRGAIYRVGHSDAHSNSKRFFQYNLSIYNLLRHPVKTLMYFLSVRRMTKKIRLTYFGVGA